MLENARGERWEFEPLEVANDAFVQAVVRISNVTTQTSTPRFAGRLGVLVAPDLVVTTSGPADEEQVLVSPIVPDRLASRMEALLRGVVQARSGPLVAHPYDSDGPGHPGPGGTEPASARARTCLVQRHGERSHRQRADRRPGVRHGSKT